MQLPEDFVNKLTTMIPHSKKEEVLRSFSEKKLPTIRINTLKISTEKLCILFDQNSITYKKIDWYMDALIITNKSTRELTATDLYHQGLFYIQSLSSIVTSLVLDPHPNEKILDIAAAPGSKTTHIAMLMENTGEIIANDMSRDRSYKLKAILTQYAITNTKVTTMPGERIWYKYPNYFDRTLVDAPCSMEGRFYTDDPATYEDWSTKKVKRLSKQQKWLLRSAVSSTKVGGIIVYSTCTLSPEENEDVIDWILKKENGKVELEEIQIKNLELMDGLLHWHDDTYDSSLGKTKRILPTDLMEGFYIAKLKKIS